MRSKVAKRIRRKAANIAAAHHLDSYTITDSNGTRRHRGQAKLYADGKRLYKKSKAEGRTTRDLEQQAKVKKEAARETARETQQQ